MLIPLGILAASGVGFADSYELISSTVLGADAASVEFTGLGAYSSTYKHLQIRGAVRSFQFVGLDNIHLRINGDTGNNYAWHALQGVSGTISSTSATSQSLIRMGQIHGRSAATGAFGGVVADILDPYSTTKNTTTRALVGTSDSGFINLGSGLWVNTSSVTSLTVFISGQNMVTGTRFSLYGLKG
jgi:hypothetical protein